MFDGPLRPYIGTHTNKDMGFLYTNLNIFYQLQVQLKLDSLMVNVEVIVIEFMLHLVMHTIQQIIKYKKTFTQICNFKIYNIKEK